MRQMRHWTTKDVAKQLNVITATIESIESDDYRELGTTVFIKGYLRLYARTLGASEEVVIEKFMQTAPKQYCQAEGISVKQPEMKENTLTAIFKQWIKTIFKQS